MLRAGNPSDGGGRDYGSVEGRGCAMGVGAGSGAIRSSVMDWPLRTERQVPVCDCRALYDRIALSRFIVIRLRKSGEQNGRMRVPVSWAGRTGLPHTALGDRTPSEYADEVSSRQFNPNAGT